MADNEYDIEELTAYLEASGDDDDEVDRVADRSSKAEQDECSLDEIAAFLEASDDEEEEEEEGKETETISDTVPAGNGDENGCEFDEDLNDDDLEQLDLLVSQSQSQQSSDPTDSQESERDVLFDTADPHAEGSTAQSTTISEAEGELAEAIDWSDDGGESVVDSHAPSDCDEDQSVNQYKSVEDKSDKANEEDETDMAHEAIKAEMAAMVARMEQLQKMLEKKSPKPSKKAPKPHSDTSKMRLLPADSKQTTGKKNIQKNDKTSESGFEKHSSNSVEKTEKSICRDNTKQIPNPDCGKGLDKNRKLNHGSVHDRQHKSDSSGIKKNSVSSHKSSAGNGASSRPVVGKEATTCHSKDKKQIHGRNGKSATGNANIIADDDESSVNPFFSSGAPQASSSQDSKVDARSIFGECSDDSDWEELDGGDKTKLSEQGREIKRLITSGERKRQAHTPNFDPSTIKKPSPIRFTESTGKKPKSRSSDKSQPEKPILDPETGTVSGKYRVKDEYKVQTTQRSAEDERQSVTDPFCGIRIINPRISMEVFKQKMSGRLMMKIPQLLSQQGVSDIQKDNWVTMGVVVHKTEPRQSASGKAYCIWKLSDLQACDKTVSFFLFGSVFKEHWKNELGIVIGLLNPSIMDKAEKAQSDMAVTINHPQQLLLMGVSKDLGRCRGTTKAGQPCTAPINKQFGEYCMYHVQKAYRNSSSKRTELQASTGVVPKAFTQKKGNTGGHFYHDGASFSTMRSQGTKPKDKITLSKLQSLEAQKSAGKVTTMSLHDLGQEQKQKLQKIADKDKNLLDMLSVPTAGSMNFVKHLVKNQDTVPKGKSSSTDKPAMKSVSAKDLLKEHQAQLQKAKLNRDKLSSVPTLGRGFGQDKTISLDLPSKSSSTSSSSSSSTAKLLAIEKIKAKGGLKKEDPNAVRKKLSSPEAVEKIKKRVADDGNESNTNKDRNDERPPAKKSKLLGGLDLNSPEVQNLLKTKSKHAGALAEAQAEHEDRYFNALEKKEKMEEKMASIKEVPVTLMYCMQCKYKFFTLHERCKQENHPTKKVKGVKRFFKCKQCKRRLISLEKMPTAACKECGSISFERVTMLKERSGPKLESEQLSLRGNEQKFVGSLQGKSFLNI